MGIGKTISSVTRHLSPGRPGKADAPASRPEATLTPSRRGSRIGSFGLVKAVMGKPGPKKAHGASVASSSAGTATPWTRGKLGQRCSVGSPAGGDRQRRESLTRAAEKGVRAQAASSIAPPPQAVGEAVADVQEAEFQRLLNELGDAGDRLAGERAARQAQQGHPSPSGRDARWQEVADPALKRLETWEPPPSAAGDDKPMDAGRQAQPDVFDSLLQETNDALKPRAGMRDLSYMTPQQIHRTAKQQQYQQRLREIEVESQWQRHVDPAVGRLETWEPTPPPAFRPKPGAAALDEDTLAGLLQEIDAPLDDLAGPGPATPSRAGQ
jgi:hypothetical protein